MAITAVGICVSTVSGATTATPTFSLITNALAAGDFMIVGINSDNSNGSSGSNNEHLSITGGSGTWTKIGEQTYGGGTAAAGVTSSMWLFEASGTVSIGTSFTLTCAAAVTNFCFGGWKFTKASDKGVRIATDPATNPLVDYGGNVYGWSSLSFSGLPSKERLYFRHLGKELSSNNGLTPTSGFTGGYSMRSSASGSATLARSEFKIATATGATSSPTMTGLGDIATIFAALEEYDFTGHLKYWNGSSWVAKPLKYWDGATWALKPLKRWNGSAWVAV